MTEFETLEVDELRSSAVDSPAPITSVTLSRGYAFISARPKDGQEEQWVARRAVCLERVAAKSISLQMLQFARSRMRFALSSDESETVIKIINECGIAWRIVPSCSKIGIVGAGLARTAGIYYRVLTALTDRNIPILAFSDSSVTITVMVQEVHGSEAEASLHALLLGDRNSPLNANITLDAVLGRVRIYGRELRLGARQAQLLAYLLDNAGRIVTSEEAAMHVFGSDVKDDVAALRVHMHNLRKKLELDPDSPRHIVTVPAQGYLFVR